MPLVIITDCDHGTIAPEEAVLRAAGVEYRLHQAKNEEDVIAVARDADAIILQYAPITGRVLDGLPRCRIAVRYGVGVDTVDLAAATARGVMVANVPDYCIEEVSDHAEHLAGQARHGPPLRRAPRPVADGAVVGGHAPP